METEITTGTKKYDGFLEGLKKIVSADRQSFSVDGKVVNMNPCWLRDHIHEMKGYKYWEKEIKTGLEHFLQRQTPRGFFYEMIVPIDNEHTKMVSPEFVQFDEKNKLAYVRLEIEADIEYLMVEGVYNVWQATGDMEWMKENLEKVERGIEYCLTDPVRFCKGHMLVKRAFTIDTWDFTYGVPTNNRRIEPTTPMAIMHGDNSGIYSSCLMLARMYGELANFDRVRYWQEKAEDFRHRTNSICWNGKFYTHQVPIQNPPSTGVNEKDILSLSNTYDINRGLPDHKMAVSIINEYIKRRKETQGKYFSEWFSIHPAYPDFCGYKPGEYINGGVAGFVAGELAKASFEHGFENYAVDILDRLVNLWKRDGTIHFLYTPDGKEYGGGPRGWGASAIISAIIEGLAGVRDESCLFERIKLSPRWASIKEEQANVSVVYGASETFLNYEYAHRGSIISMSVEGNKTREISFHILLPEGKKAKKVVCAGKTPQFTNLKIEKSSYVDFVHKGSGKVEIYVEM